MSRSIHLAGATPSLAALAAEIETRFPQDGAGAGDPEMAAKRLALVADCELLQITEAVDALAAALLARGLVPTTVPNDALHIAVATIGRAEYLLTWNLRHLAGAVARRRIEHELRRLGHEPPTICTPEELMP
jgi:hypothetical protein